MGSRHQGTGVSGGLISEQPGWGLSLFFLALSFLMGVFIRAHLRSSYVTGVVHKILESQTGTIDFSEAEVLLSCNWGWLPCLRLEIRELRAKLPSLNQRQEQGQDQRQGEKEFGDEEDGGEVGPSGAALTFEIPLLWAPIELEPLVSEGKFVVSKGYGEVRIRGGGLTEDLGVEVSPQFEIEHVEKEKIESLGGQGNNSLNQWNLHLWGDLREGRYSLNLQYVQGEPNEGGIQKGQNVQRNQSPQGMGPLESWDGRWLIEGDLDHIPLAVVVPFLQRRGWVQEDINGRQIWSSFHLSGESSSRHLEQAQLRLESFLLEGEIGEVHIPQILFSSLNPIKIQPFQADLRRIKLEEVLRFTKNNHPSPTLGALGTFNGQLFWEGPQSVKVQGEHSGLEFIFANREERETQVVSVFSCNAFWKGKGTWEIVLDQVRLLEGVFNGKIFLRANTDDKHLAMELEAEEILLGPGVQKLMTGGGTMGPISSQLSLLFSKGDLMGLEGEIRGESMSIDSTHLGPSVWKIRTVKNLPQGLIRNLAKISHAREENLRTPPQRGDFFQIDVKVKEIRADMTSPVMGILGPVLGEKRGVATAGSGEEGLRVTDFKGQMWTRALGDFFWEVQASMKEEGFPLRVSLQGGWDSGGGVFGNLLTTPLSGSTEFMKKWRKKGAWRLEGDRRHPSLVPVSTVL